MNDKIDPSEDKKKKERLSIWATLNLRAIELEIT